MLAAEHSKAQCNRIVAYIGSDRQRFAELVNDFLAGPYHVTQRAAWPMSYAAIAHPELVKPHLGKLISVLGSAGIHDAVKRNILRLLPSVRIPATHHEKLIGLCFDFLTCREEPVAVHVFAMEVLAKLVEPYPDLKRELGLIIEGNLPYGSPAYRSRAMKILAGIGFRQ